MTVHSHSSPQHRDPLPDLFDVEDSGWIDHLPSEPVDPPFPLVSQRTRDELERFGPLMEQDYEDFKENLITWLSAVGKSPEKGKGLADATLHTTHYKLEVVFRWLWRTRGEYTTEITPTEADEFMAMMVNFSDKQESDGCLLGLASSEVSVERTRVLRSTFSKGKGSYSSLTNLYMSPSGETIGDMNDNAHRVQPDTP